MGFDDYETINEWETIQSKNHLSGLYSEKEDFVESLQRIVNFVMETKELRETVEVVRFSALPQETQKRILNMKVSHGKTRGTYIAPGLCNHSMELAMKEYPAFVERHQTEGITLDKDHEFSRKWIQYRKKFERMCVHLGPEEGGFYSEPYCIECLQEIVKDLQDASKSME